MKVVIGIIPGLHGLSMIIQNNWCKTYLELASVLSKTKHHGCFPTFAMNNCYDFSSLATGLVTCLDKLGRERLKDNIRTHQILINSDRQCEMYGSEYSFQDPSDGTYHQSFAKIQKSEPIGKLIFIYLYCNLYCTL